jgi:radical SAM superfamily enzyme YgiQ (UPF0313 family)
VAVLFPGPAAQGAGSLALHRLLGLINDHPRGAAEAVFDPRRGPPRGWSSGRPLADFDLLLASLAHEAQWPVLVALLAAAGIPPRRRRRDARHPLLVAGGVACRLNPAPAAPFLDAVVPGDAEPVIAPLLDALHALRGAGRAELRAALAAVAGVGAPPERGRPVRAVWHDAGPPAVQLAAVHGGELAGMHLVETGRGCPAGCRFCALSFSRRPPVFYPVAAVVAAARPGIERGARIGLVGASLGRHPELAELVAALGAVGADLSPASLDPVALTRPAGRLLLRELARAGQRSLTLAPEAGSERLRRVINKPFTDEVLFEAVRRLGEAGVVHLKLYLMWGLPEEQPEDRLALVELVAGARRALLAAHRGRGGTGRLSVSLNPFVPKPHTPFALEPMPTRSALRRDRARIERALKRLGGVDVAGFGPGQAIGQCLLDRADERLAPVLERSGRRWPPPAGLLDEALPEWRALVHRAWPPGRPPPWRLVDTGVAAGLLDDERRRAAAARPTAPCEPLRCERCRACTGLTPNPNR